MKNTRRQCFRRDPRSSLKMILYQNLLLVAKKALETGRSIYDIVLEEGILTQEDLDASLDPENMIRPVRLDIHARK